jgi:hypothetical protein
VAENMITRRQISSTHIENSVNFRLWAAVSKTGKTQVIVSRAVMPKSAVLF